MDDPLNLSVPLAGVETDLPLLPEADYQFQVKESTVDANKLGDGRNWNIKFGLATKATATDGREVNPDFPVFICDLSVSAVRSSPRVWRPAGEGCA